MQTNLIPPLIGIIIPFIASIWHVNFFESQDPFCMIELGIPKSAMPKKQRIRSKISKMIK